jgi:hypothetical protein
VQIGLGYRCTVDFRFQDTELHHECGS